jgi:hypothetical protein
MNIEGQGRPFDYLSSTCDQFLPILILLIVPLGIFRI